MLWTASELSLSGWPESESELNCLRGNNLALSLSGWPECFATACGRYKQTLARAFKSARPGDCNPIERPMWGEALCSLGTHELV